MKCVPAEVLAVNSGVITKDTTDDTPVIYLTLRFEGQLTPVNLAITNPHRLIEGVEKTADSSKVLAGGEFVEESYDE